MPNTPTKSTSVAFAWVHWIIDEEDIEQNFIDSWYHFAMQAMWRDA